MIISRNNIRIRLLVILGYVISVTILLWYLEKRFYNLSSVFITIDNSILITDQALRYLGQISGFLAIVFLSLNYILSARFKIIEDILGGLDQLYRVHAFIGISSFILIILHPLLLASYFLDIPELFRSYFIPYSSNSLALNLGIIGFWFFVIILFIASAKRLSYHLWKIVHSFIGVPLLLISGHALIAGKTTEYLPLEVWVLVWIILGVGAYIYKVFLYDFIGPVYKYRITKIQKFRELYEFFMEPVNEERAMNFEAGQFAFLQFLQKNVSMEPHPFTMSSAPNEKELKFSIKKLGDWSSRLHDLKEGSLVKVVGPYGHFTRLYFRRCQKQVWIGGGVGITPFLSMAKRETKYKTCDDIYLIYTDDTDEEAVFADEIREYDNIAENLVTKIHITDKEGYITAEKIEKLTNGIEDTIFLICGPTAMKEALFEQLRAKGIPSSDIIFEEFEFK